MSNEYKDEDLMELFLQVSMMSRRNFMMNKRDPRQIAQFRLLSLINATGKINQRELVDILQVRSASLSELLKKLESNGMIVREKDETDKRNFIVSLTEKGQGIAQKAKNERKEMFTEMLSSLSDEEKQQFSDILEKLYQSWNDNFKDSGEETLGFGGPGCRFNHGPGPGMGRRNFRRMMMQRFMF